MICGSTSNVGPEIDYSDSDSGDIPRKRKNNNYKRLLPIPSPNTRSSELLIMSFHRRYLMPEIGY